MLFIDIAFLIFIALYQRKYWLNVMLILILMLFYHCSLRSPLFCPATTEKGLGVFKQCCTSKTEESPSIIHVRDRKAIHHKVFFFFLCQCWYYFNPLFFKMLLLGAQVEPFSVELSLTHMCSHKVHLAEDEENRQSVVGRVQWHVNKDHLLMHS